MDIINFIKTDLREITKNHDTYQSDNLKKFPLEVEPTYYYDFDIQINDTIYQQYLCVPSMLISGEVEYQSFELFTCSCGNAGCAGIHDDIELIKDEYTVVFLVPKEAGYPFDKKMYVFDRTQYQNAIKKIRLEVEENERKGHLCSSFYNDETPYFSHKGILDHMKKRTQKINQKYLKLKEIFGDLMDYDIVFSYDFSDSELNKYSKEIKFKLIDFFDDNINSENFKTKAAIFRESFKRENFSEIKRLMIKKIHHYKDFDGHILYGFLNQKELFSELAKSNGDNYEENKKYMTSSLNFDMEKLKINFKFKYEINKSENNIKI